MDQASRFGATPAGRWPGRLLLAQRVASVGVALLVAVVTLLPRRIELQYSVLAEGRTVGGEVGATVIGIVIALAGFAVMGLIWKSRIAARLRLSWPLFVVVVFYLAGLTVLASSAVRGAMLRWVATGLGGWFHQISSQLDGEHAVAYAGLTMIMALAWRDKVRLPWLALGLFAFGCVLEVLQELVPERETRLGDAAANGAGIAFGVSMVLILDLLVAARKKHAVRSRVGDRRSRRLRSAPSRTSRRAANMGLIITLAGFLVVLASVLAGSMVELQLGRIGWRILTFSSAYGVAFWLGVLAMAAGLLVISGRLGGGREQPRLMRPRSARRRVP